MGIWKVNKIGIEQVWYPKEMVDKIVAVCEEQNLKYDNVACEILNIIQEAEGED